MENGWEVRKRIWDMCQDEITQCGAVAGSRDQVRSQKVKTFLNDFAEHSVEVLVSFRKILQDKYCTQFLRGVNQSVSPSRLAESRYTLCLKYNVEERMPLCDRPQLRKQAQCVFTSTESGPSRKLTIFRTVYHQRGREVSTLSSDYYASITCESS